MGFVYYFVLFWSFQRINRIIILIKRALCATIFEYFCDKNRIWMTVVTSSLQKEQEILDVPIVTAIFTYLSYALLYLMGHLHDFLCKMNLVPNYGLQEDRAKGFVPLLLDFESFYTRNMYRRIMDCWNRPIVSNPGAIVEVVERSRPSCFAPLRPTGRTIKAINMGSYNYLGFGDSHEICVDHIKSAIATYGVATCSAVNEYGYLQIHQELERVVADFVGKEEAICYPMGFATNSANIPALLDDKCCIISDELNHASLVLGSRLSSCKIFRFKHNDMEDLEALLRDIIIQGRHKTHRDWKKIILIIEGIYSMEGTYIDLPAIVKLKQKYKFYIYLDEAHSIGCTGATGRGVAEHFNIDTKEIDIMMGTFTKSFGSCGGYVAADKNIISYIRQRSFCNNYGCSMSPLVCAQIISAINILTGKVGQDIGRKKLSDLRQNIVYFRRKLREMGFIIYGHDSSPVVPLLIYMPGKVGPFSRMMLERGVAIVVVGFPATSILTARTRFCISSSHTKEMLDYVLNCVDELGTKIRLKYNKDNICI